MNAQAITWPQGRYNPAGTTRVFYAFQEDILTFPELDDPESATTFESLVNYTDPITMKEGKQFHELYHTVETGELRSTVVGSRDGKGFENFLELSFPGNQALILGFLAATANRNIIALVEEKNKVIRVLGSLTDPAFIDTNEYTSGKAIADARANILTLKASGATAPPIYTLAIADLLVPAS